MRQRLFIIFLVLYVLSVPFQLIAQENSSSHKSPAYTLEQLQDARLSDGIIYRLEIASSIYITPRPVDIWLPKGYSKESTYSVLYMHDGQMLFDANTTWNKQEWKVDEWASNLWLEVKRMTLLWLLFTIFQTSDG